MPYSSHEITLTTQHTLFPGREPIKFIFICSWKRNPLRPSRHASLPKHIGICWSVTGIQKFGSRSPPFQRSKFMFLGCLLPIYKAVSTRNPQLKWESFRNKGWVLSDQSGRFWHAAPPVRKSSRLFVYSPAGTASLIPRLRLIWGTDSGAKGSFP